MRKLATLALAVFAVMALAVPAMAQPDDFDLGIFFDENGTISEGNVPGFAPQIPLYFVMLSLGEQIEGYENSVAIMGTDSETWTVTRGVPVGIDVDPDIDGYVVGIGVCAGTPGGNYTINVYSFGFFSGTQGPFDTQVCAGIATTSVPSIPGFAAYQVCAGGLEVSGFAQASVCRPEVSDGCAIINPSNPGCVIATEESSWGAVKANY